MSKVLCASQYLPLSITMDKSGWKENSQWGGGRAGWSLFLVSRPLCSTWASPYSNAHCASPFFLPTDRGSLSMSVPETGKSPPPALVMMSNSIIGSAFECPQISHLFGNCCLSWRKIEEQNSCECDYSPFIFMRKRHFKERTYLFFHGMWDSRTPEITEQHYI